jgi:hypothetical protein
MLADDGRNITCPWVQIWAEEVSLALRGRGISLAATYKIPELSDKVFRLAEKTRHYQ